MAALLAVVGGVLFALLRHQAAGGAAGAVGYTPANSAAGSEGWWGWLVGGGGLGTRHPGGGFELTDLQGGNREAARHRRGGGDGLDDEFFVGDGRRGKDVASGPGYASLLEGQEQ